MMTILIKGGAVSSEVRAIVTRVDGTTKNLGRIAYYHHNPIVNAFGNYTIKAKERIRKWLHVFKMAD